jgi:hypothetical protein
MFKKIIASMLVLGFLGYVGVDYAQKPTQTREQRLEQDCNLRTAQSAYWMRGVPGDSTQLTIKALNVQAETMGCWE